MVPHLNINPNTYMIRYYDEDRFEIYASRNIEKDEELNLGLFEWIDGNQIAGKNFV